ncbi:MAG: IS110 family transposase [Saprospiraceae bacterium]|nr:IS110 family transposase [Candidatus Brachybacter algidus]
MKNKVIDFSGQNIYVGLDVHKKSWSATVLTDELEHRTFTIVPDAKMLTKYLEKNFPGANYYSAYEAGFCGFTHHRELNENGVKNIVVNASDVPSTNKDYTTKTDNVDSRKIARALRAKTLKSIHVFDRDHEEFRGLARQRQIFQRDLRRYKQRIKSFLMYYGIDIPEELVQSDWSKSFESWLGKIRLSTNYGNSALENLVIGYRFHKDQVRQVSIELRASARKFHKKEYYLLRTIPGVGPLTSIALITEIGDIKRFKTINQFCSYVGLMPMSFSSGETERIGGMTFRNNTWLRSMLVEASWQAVRKDPAMLLYYKQHVNRGNGKRAIIKVARKLLARIRFVLMNQQAYELGMQCEPTEIIQKKKIKQKMNKK